MLYILFSFGWEPVIIHWILLGFEWIQEITLPISIIKELEKKFDRD